jgi:hypothetical protein
MWFDKSQLVVEGAVDLSLSQNINHLRVQYPKSWIEKFLEGNLSFES